MKKNMPILLVLIGISIAVAVICAVFLEKVKSRENVDIYTIITDARFATLLNDGGSHTDTRYEVDLKRGVVTKLEGYYKGFEGWEYQNKKLYSKNLNDAEIKAIKNLFDNIEQNSDKYNQDTENNYMYYTYSHGEVSIDLYDREIINEIEKVLKNN